MTTSSFSILDRPRLIAAVLLLAVLSFEVFNFDTTRFALDSLLGQRARLGPLPWAVVLAVAFCAIDFAGLARIFTPERGDDEPRAVWYLMGAWLLGATMNAVLTWHAVVVVLGDHDAGTALLTQAQLLRTVPIFVAALVWLTRILLIAALSISAEAALQPQMPRPTRADAAPAADTSSTAEPPTVIAETLPPPSAAQRAAQRAVLRPAAPVRASANDRHGAAR